MSEILHFAFKGISTSDVILIGLDGTDKSVKNLNLLVIFMNYLCSYSFIIYEISNFNNVLLFIARKLPPAQSVNQI